MRGVVGSSTDTRLFNPLQRQNMIPVSSQNTQRQNILKSFKYSFHRLKNIENLLTMWTNNRNKNMERANPPNLQNGYLQFRKAQFPNFQITAHERISKVPTAPPQFLNPITKGFILWISRVPTPPPPSSPHFPVTPHPAGGGSTL